MEVTTLDTVVRRGLEDGQCVRVKLPSGRFSKPYPVVGSMFRNRGHETFVARARRPGDAWDAGRRYLAPTTTVMVEDA